MINGRKIERTKIMTTLTLRLTVDNVSDTLRPGDVFAEDPTCPPVKSARPTVDGFGNAMITFADGSRDVLGLPQTVEINRADPREPGSVSHSTSSVGVVWVTAYGSADEYKTLRRRIAAYSRTHGFGRAVSEGASFHGQGATVEIRVCYSVKS